MFGASGTIGTAVQSALQNTGHEVVASTRPGQFKAPIPPGSAMARNEMGAAQCPVDVLDPASVAMAIEQFGPFDAVVSCMASRTGMPHDAWLIDHDAHMNVLLAAQAAGVPKFVLLSAICVQKPRLQFQFAKLAFENALKASGLAYTIVRPTAYFKSLSGQVARVLAGKPYLLFGDGRLTACKPISDSDLAAFMVKCLSDPESLNKLLPVGGPGPAVTPLEQGEYLFEALGARPRYKRVPVRLMDGIAGGLALAGTVVPKLSDKAEFARIGRYYATESMLVWDPEQKRYDASQTPEFGSDTLFTHYDALLAGTEVTALGDHSVFGS
ncbi:NAD(P)H-binding protein [Roseibium hamelinense]|uniref:NAD(P)H-binding protein n=1 Tax=Roseibium hamelinense TaxID=150831 RepID=UPI001AD8D76A|nr:NAD(P)H-binding protein [Roseibium hamelinense]